MNRSSPFLWSDPLKFVYIHNPFYLISACLVLYGLRQAFSADGSLTGGGLMMALLCGYTLLLAVTGYVVIRFGRVWQDARMILLVMVLLLQVLPLNFEEIALRNPLAGAGFELLSFLFAVAVSEGLLWSLKMRLPAMYRLPYYSILALLYFYPIPLAHWSLEGQNSLMTWGVFLFPTFAAASFLMLMVAARRGGQPRRPNGTPWAWPWYPWTLFVVLGLGVGIRSFELSRSFEAAGGVDAAWQPYFLTPLLLVAALLLLEGGVAVRNRTVQRIAIFAPMAALLVAFPGGGSNVVQMQFLALLRDTIGCPAQLSLFGLAVFYLYACFRKVPLAEGGLIGCLLLSSVIDYQTVNFATLAEPNMTPVWAVAAMQLVLAAVQRSSWRWSLGCLLAILAGGCTLRHTLPADHILYFTIHLAIVTMLITGVIFRDRLAWTLRVAVPYLVPLLAGLAAVAYDRIFPDLPAWMHLQYIALVTACGFLYWVQVPHIRHLKGSLVSAGIYCVAAARQLYVLLQTSVVEKGLNWIVWGMAFLALAVLISFIKGGLIRKLWRVIREVNDARRIDISASRTDV